MTRYCCICRSEITDEHRQRVASPYCSQACKTKSDNARRESRRKAFCESCGRRYRAKAIKSPGTPASSPAVAAPNGLFTNVEAGL